jgi:hypothetical protein
MQNTSSICKSSLRSNVEWEFVDEMRNIIGWAILRESLSVAHRIEKVDRKNLRGNFHISEQRWRSPLNLNRSGNAKEVPSPISFLAELSMKMNSEFHLEIRVKWLTRWKTFKTQNFNSGRNYNWLKWWLPKHIPFNSCQSGSILKIEFPEEGPRIWIPLRKPSNLSFAKKILKFEFR